MSIRSKILNSLGLEDGSQVEVNFHIDTDAESKSGDSETSESTVEESVEVAQSVAEVAEADAETEASENDVEELEAAQDSLESLKVQLEFGVQKGGISNESAGFYRTALESIIGKHNLTQMDLISVESFSDSPIRATVLSLEQLNDLIGHIENISMEAKLDFLETLKHKIGIIINADKALLKQAQALLTMAHSAGNEKADTKTISSGKIKWITTETWNNDSQFLKLLAKFSGVYASLSDVKNRDGDVKSQTDEAFGRIPGYNRLDTTPLAFFGGVLKKDDTGRVRFETTKNKEPKDMPVLTPSGCISILNEVIKMTQGRSSDVETVNTFVRDPQIAKLLNRNPDGPKSVNKQIVSTINLMASHRVRVLNEVLNYVQLSLTNRTVDSTIS